MDIIFVTSPMLIVVFGIYFIYKLVKAIPSMVSEIRSIKKVEKEKPIHEIIHPALKDYQLY